MDAVFGDDEVRQLVDVFDRAAAGLAVGDAAGTQLLRVNRALCDLLGRPEAEILGHDLREYTHPDDVARTDSARRAGMRDGYEKRYVRPDGSIVWALVGGEVVTDAGGNPRHFVGSIVDITARKEAEEELRRSVSRQEAVLALGRMALQGAQLDDLFSAAVRLVGEHLGVERTAVLEVLPGGAELLLRAGSGWLSAVQGQMRVPIDASVGGYAVRTGEAVTTEDLTADPRFRVPQLRMENVVSAALVVIHVDGRPWGTLGAHALDRHTFTGPDVAFLQSLADVLAAAIARCEHEDAARRALDQEQLAIVGRLAAGLAHDLSNVLTVIKLHAELLTLAPTLAAESREQAKAIGEQSEHAISLVWQLLDVAHRHEFEPVDIDLRAFLQELAPVLRRTQRGVEVSTDFADSRVVVRGDRGRLNQVILNLLSNAVDASSDRGKVCLRTTVGSDPSGVPGVTLSVIDHGAGMTPEVSARAFEPFFSTKAVGMGTGLGLAQVKALVEQHGGTVELESTVGSGTVVSVWLPIAPGRTPIDDDTGAVPRGSGELVLVVEDDAAARSTVAALLGEIGYATVLARDGLEALALLETTAGVALVLVDLDRSRTGGAQLAMSLADAPVEVPVVLTGLERAPGGLPDDPRFHWLQKPYSRRDLAETLAAFVRS